VLGLLQLSLQLLQFKVFLILSSPFSPGLQHPQVPTARSAILRRNSSDKTDSSVVSRVASGLRSNNSSERDIITSPDKPSTSVLDSPNSSEASSAVYQSHYLHNVHKTDNNTSEDEVDTPRQTEPSLIVIAKPRITPRRLKPSTPDKEIWGPPESKPPEPPSKDAEMVDNQNSEERNLPPSTPPENLQSSPPSSPSDPDEVQAPSSTNSLIAPSTIAAKVNKHFFVHFGTSCSDLERDTNCRPKRWKLKQKGQKSVYLPWRQ